MKYSVIVPIYEEERNIQQLDLELRKVMDKLGSYEIIYVNDGSRDESLKELKKLDKVTYYYYEYLKEYQGILKDRKRLGKKAMSLLYSTPLQEISLWCL